MSKRYPLLGVLVLLLGLLLAACGDATSTPPATTAAATTAAAGTTAAGATTAAAGTAAATTASGGGTAASATCPNPGAALNGEIKLGAGAPITGDSALFGVAMTRGWEMAQEEINACGGINGKKLTLVVRDDQAKADVGVTNIRELIDNKDIIGFIGTANTAVGVQQAPIANQSKLPWLITVTTGSKVTQDPAVAPQYVFRVSMVDSEQAPFVAETVISKYKKIALIGDETGYGQLGIQDVTTALKAKNVDPIVTITYKNAGTSDEMKPMVQQIKASGADAIISWGLSAANANIRKAMKDLSVDLPFHGSWGISRPDYADLAGDLATGTIVPQTLSVDTKVQKQLDFFDKYRKKYNTQQVGFPSGLGQSYDGLWIMAIALRSLNGQETRDKLRDALESFGTYDGLVKKYDKPFANKFHEAFTKADFFFGVWKDGKIVRQS